MKKIPTEVRSLIRASIQLNNHSKAIEELVYNSLDAGASAIAIRVDVQGNTIQVIDNGSGISSNDFKLLGHKYTSSKYVDLDTLKSVPNKYGFRGQALSSLVNISRSVKVVSRHENSQETWMKLFEQGLEKQLVKCNTRPSKGTTVEVTGFLYNLNMQNKSNDKLQSLQSIKTFLEHISLVHCNVSLSLRDDCRNEIVFKIHKNRDVPQTLSTLYNIEKNKLQELQVEKNEYKVTAYISKSDYEAGKHFIFLNGQFLLKSSKLHKIVNKSMKQRCIQKAKIKEKVIEESIIQKNIPDYCIFLKCPYADYELSNSPKQSVLEFKDWDQIMKLIDKVIKFFNGDVILKKVNNVEENKTTKRENTNTREQVKKIMERILGNSTKKAGSVNLRNGINGKQVKRKSKKAAKKATVKVTENEPKNKLTINSQGREENLNNQSFDMLIKYNNECIDSNAQNTDENIGTKTNSKIVTKTKARGSVGKIYNKHFKKIPKTKRSDVNEVETQKNHMNKKISKNKSRHKRNLMLRKPKITESVKKRCDELHKNTMILLHQMHNIIMNEDYKVKTKYKNRINVTVRRQIQEIVIQNKPKQTKTEPENVQNKLVQSNYDLLQTILKSQRDSSRSNIQKRNLPGKMNGNIADKMNNESYGYQKVLERNPKAAKIPKLGVHRTKNKESENKHTEPIITYESHNCYARQSIHTEKNTSYHSHVQICNEKRTFITKQSRDNFIMPNESLKRHNFKRKQQFRSKIPTQIQTHIKNLFKQTSKLFNLKKKILGATCESSFTIEVTESNKFRSKDRAIMSNLSQNARTNVEEIRSQSMNYNRAANDNDHIAINSGTIELPNVDYSGNSKPDEGFSNWGFHGTYTIERADQIISNTESQDQNTNVNQSIENNKNFIFISKSQEHEQYDESIYPINVCETILNSEEIIEREFEMSFSNEPNRLSTNNNKDNAHLLDNLYTNEIEHIYDDDCQKITKVSHHFDSPYKQVLLNEAVNFSKSNIESPIIANVVNLNMSNNEIMQEVYKKEKQSNTGDFIFNNRLCFIPKGFSPIFQTCKTKNVCEYNLSKDYYEKELYNNFAENVRNNAEVFEPKIQGVKEGTTKATDKVNIKLVIDKSALKFNGESLNDAKVFGQIDEKFIAATMKELGNNESLDYLVLFDQHAVHERIRLEKNLDDYLKENKWKAVPIDAVMLKLSKDETLYLHNFNDKFEQLGLQWNMINNEEISISAIPEAILGKNSRQVEKVMKAVKNLITEEINILRMQGGCVSLYPKSIMDLVFSEACRYAIKFGDKLSKAVCVELIKTLSGCKTPFQCAHGRPVMAVVMEIKPSCVDYKINIKKILEWKKNKLLTK